MSGRLVVLEITALLPIPPSLSGLNKVEHVWQSRRQNGLSNHVFRSNDNIIAHRCRASTKLADQTWRIMALGLR